MADLTITAANVVKGANAQINNGIAGVAITAGQSVYLDGSSNTYKLALNDSVPHSAVVGIALNNAAAGQPLAVQTGGQITIGATVAAGVPYWSSANAGGICPFADIGSGKYTTLIGIGISSSIIQLGINASGISQ